MKKIFLLFTLISSFLTIAQTAPSIQWQKSLGGSSSDIPYAIQQTTDGGYIIAGESRSTNGDVTGHHGPSGDRADFWIVKINSSGIIQWQKSLGGSNGDIANSIQQTTDGGYIVAGTSTSNNGDVSGHHGCTDCSTADDGWVVKLDSNGNLQWQKSLGGSDEDSLTSIRQTSDGGYIAVGNSYSNDGDVSGNHGGHDYWLVKLDPNGNIQWQKSLGGSLYEFANSVEQTTDGGYVIAGFSRSNNGDVSGNKGYEDFWIVKVDDSGNIQWQKSLGGTFWDVANSIKQTTDGGYIVAGYSYSIDGDVSGHHGTAAANPDYWVVKIDNSGNIQWQKSLGGNSSDIGRSVMQTADGGYIVAGSSASSDGDVTGNNDNSFNYWIVKLDVDGNIQWQKSLGGSSDDEAFDIQQTYDGGYIVAGYSQSNDGDVSGHHDFPDFWIVKLSAEGLATAETANSKINIYPNPVKEIINFSEEVFNVKITDVSGRTVKRNSAKGKSIDVSTLTKGVYIISATTNAGEIVHRKFVKE